VRLRPESSKNGEGRTLALEDELWELIERRWHGREYKTASGPAIAPLVFHHRGVPIGDFRKAWASACIEAGLFRTIVLADGAEQKLPIKLFHDLRRTAVRNMIRAGVSQPVAMKISGHRTAAIFRRYDITTEADIRDAMRRTQAHIAAQPVKPTVVPFAVGAGR
jgi:integrase